MQMRCAIPLCGQHDAIRRGGRTGEMRRAQRCKRQNLTQGARHIHLACAKGFVGLRASEAVAARARAQRRFDLLRIKVGARLTQQGRGAANVRRGAAGAAEPAILAPKPGLRAVERGRDIVVAGRSHIEQRLAVDARPLSAEHAEAARRHRIKPAAETTRAVRSHNHARIRGGRPDHAHAWVPRPGPFCAAHPGRAVVLHERAEHHRCADRVGERQRKEARAERITQDMKIEARGAAA